MSKSADMNLKARVFFTSVSKSNWFYYVACTIELKICLPYQITSKTKTTGDSLAHVFPRFVSATMPARRIYFECYLVDSMTAQSDFNLWFPFHDTQMKTALKFVQI